MRKSLSITTVVAAGVLVLAGCSGTPQEQAGAAAPSAPVAAAAGLTSLSSAAAAESDRNTITAQGTGKVLGTPDIATIGLGVETNAASAKDALDQNNKIATDLITVLKDNGVAAEDLQTSQLSVNPVYDDKSTITGYQVTNLVTVTLRDIPGAGALIDLAGRTAGNSARVQQLSFSIDDDSELKATARADAVKQAQTQAKQMADAAGVQLGAIHSITEVPTYDAIPYATATADSAAAAPSVPIEPGSQELNVVVQVVYDIAQ
ncbi:SIMPL domain-containing protein [Nakamurella sp. GG22]